MNKITKDDIKRLTLFLNEQYHDYHISEGKGLSSCSCGRQGIFVRDVCANANRTFTTDNDSMILLRKMSSNHLKKFHSHIQPRTQTPVHLLRLISNPERLCKEISDYLSK